MDSERLNQILGAFRGLSIAVVGDFFLDKYWEIDPGLAEVSLETGLEAHQIVTVRNYPGAAGTVVNNLAALGVGRIFTIGFTGIDGNGFDLRLGLMQGGVELDDLLELRDRRTPTYVKPMMIEAGKPPRQIERMDIKNRLPLPRATEDEIIERTRARLPMCHGLIVADQVEEENCGVLTERVRDELTRLGEAHPDKVLFADSRRRIGQFRYMIVKPNQGEASQSLGLETKHLSPQQLVERLSAWTGRPACITFGARGLMAHDGQDTYHIPGYVAGGPVDIVGAGDSLTAAMSSALCAGATFAEAAFVGNLVASITVQQIGVTGTASLAQLAPRFLEYAQRFPELCEQIG